jgi:ABC-type nitrate/sulfonate/bicarbonate transport system substrate-binding protein
MFCLHTRLKAICWLVIASAFFVAIDRDSAHAQTKLTMQAATSAPGIGTTDFYVADKAGFLKEEGLQIEVRYATNASQAAQIVASGGADFGRFAFDPVLQGYDKGLRLRSFYQYYRTLIYYLAVPPESPIMQAINAVWAKTTLAEREAFHRFTCENSRAHADLAVVQSISERFKAAVEAAQN